MATTTKKVAVQEVSGMAKEQMLAEHKTKSATIRALAANGMARAEIARFLDIRYQHVRNVLTQPLKKND